MYLFHKIPIIFFIFIKAYKTKQNANDRFYSLS